MRAFARCLFFALLIVGVFVVPAKADTFNFSFSLDQANCTVGLNGTDCSTVINASGTFTANPFQLCIAFPNLLCGLTGYQVQALTGELNGGQMTFVPPTGQYPVGGIINVGPNGSVVGDGPNSCCFLVVAPGVQPIEFTANGQSWGWGGNDFYGKWDFLYSGNQTFPIAWNITAVPEPSTLLLLGVGLLSLVGLVCMLPSRKMDSKWKGVSAASIRQSRRLYQRSWPSGPLRRLSRYVDGREVPEGGTSALFLLAGLTILTPFIGLKRITRGL